VAKAGYAFFWFERQSRDVCCVFEAIVFTFFAAVGDRS
jgi:hypothetical protein